ncbi:HAMP domain-containing histidine kinase [Paeniglutamicibacter sp. ABSL32-1]|uniref:MtrAB system histidine kinase MtrB n=1 Tax=Paeniglutamicibacter quisquiliarum TaxID=2849498 RepID=UPI001C2D077A|nr:MtrAB system histidine kinase MtrB [Paeniglutamicibacter quisquiliarum]MBV1780397.1 HAMP domain-containing histidine kinase [Paeniglutamicibacter quisquiliarum]
METVEPARAAPAAPAHHPRTWDWPRRALAALVRARNTMRSRWTRSLLFRTVTSAMLLSAVAMLGAGAFLSNQIAIGLFQERFNQVESESLRGLNQVRAIFDSAATTDRSSTHSLVTSTLKILEGDTALVPRDFVLVPLPGDDDLYVGPTASGNLTSRIVPEALAAQVRESNATYWQSIEVNAGASAGPGLIFGTKVTLPPGREYGLYLVYDLTSVQKTLDFINRAMGLVGGLLLLVVGGITWYVTRAVVRPVAAAAQVSEKLAAGQLQERMVVSGEDETARLGNSFNHMAESLQDQINQLATLSQMQQRFVSDVSHELRTPLTTVRMAAEVLHDAREDFDPINKRSAELLYNQVERFQILLNDLLEVSRFDAGVAVLDAEPNDLVTVARRVIDAATPHADAMGSVLRLGTPSGGAVAEMDARRIERVVRNLVMNAIEHGEGNPIDITVAGNQNAVAITVRDRGIGMSPEAAGRVFDRFWRADPARARTTGGSGLGLSIAMEDTRLHEGRLEAWGERGVGSCFRLTLPRILGNQIVASPLPLEPIVLADAVLEAGKVVSFPLTGEIPAIGFKPAPPLIPEASPGTDAGAPGAAAHTPGRHHPHD